MVKLILDTDLDTDCDDVGTFAVLHAMADAGLCELLGVVCSVPISDCAPAARALNAAYRRPEIPVARVAVPDYPDSPTWEAYRRNRTRMYGSPHTGGYPTLLAEGQSAEAEDAVRLYRRLLADAPDGSVVILAIGTLTALAQLLDSGPDDLSPLDGEALVRTKVLELVSMALAPYPYGRDDFNWLMDSVSTDRVLRDWPSLLTVSHAGHFVLTGARFVAALPPDHPARRAYVAFLGGEGRVRPSWDQITALWAVLGPKSPLAASGPRGLAYDAYKGQHHWTAYESGPVRRLVTPLLSDSALAVEIENWMLRSV